MQVKKTVFIVEAYNRNRYLESTDSRVHIEVDSKTVKSEDG
ncbi:hypothetical protein [Wukongibacter sp. M2B1]